MLEYVPRDPFARGANVTIHRGSDSGTITIAMDKCQHLSLTTTCELGRNDASWRRSALKTPNRKRDSQPGQVRLSFVEPTQIKICAVLLQLLVSTAFATLPMPGRSQSLAHSEDALGNVATTTSGQLDMTYVRPTQKTMLSNFVFDAFGPYPIAGSAVAAGI